jgi:hypothetical protein
LDENITNQLKKNSSFFFLAYSINENIEAQDVIGIFICDISTSTKRASLKVSINTASKFKGPCYRKLSYLQNKEILE